MKKVIPRIITFILYSAAVLYISNAIHYMLGGLKAKSNIAMIILYIIALLIIICICMIISAIAFALLLPKQNTLNEIEESEDDNGEE